MSFIHLLLALADMPLAIAPTKLDAIVAFLERRIVAGERLGPEDLLAIAPAKADREPMVSVYDFDPDVYAESLAMAAEGDVLMLAGQPAPPPTAGQKVAVLNVHGIIAQRVSNMQMSGPGGTGTESVGRELDALLADPTVSAIVQNIDSPGGSVYGVEELASKIRAGRAKKPIISQVNSVCASAAYWIGAQGGEVVMTPSGEAGSIGVYTMHEDVSRMAEQLGVKHTVISAGKNKVEGSRFAPLSEEARHAIEERVNAYYGQFTRAVSAGRNVPVDDVRSERFGQGRSYGAAESVRRGIADRTATLEQTLARLGANRNATAAAARARAADDETPVRTEDPAQPPAELNNDFDMRRRRARMRQHV